MAVSNSWGVKRITREGSLSKAVLEQLERRITSGDTPVGSKLPTESELCDAFGVSRTVIREAITHLKSLGLVETRRGVGTTVLRTDVVEPRPAVHISPTTVEDILQVLELRLTLEPSAAELAALRHDAEDRARLEARHAEFSAVQASQSQARREDFAFHHAIVKATHNVFFDRFYEPLSESMIPRSKLLSIDIDPSSSARYLELVQQEHARILEAILERDGPAARTAMHDHLNRSKEMYARYLEE
ncbi:FadR/GntR family transcriptional regulator [Halomonas elongata]|uniref:FadR/GntR family transcriptional regulator n=1 Tax=Halomonas elongata (strain ATCC 33173 / DSM 2581 / NBRC 15536 / NCIMB 2198 / 1H9) TaxID=768066 RepID=E1V6Q8_HALED|nr:FadR/GntR family transcriptional regulator [Halomonas elongata]MBW5801597.1 FadR family transcriptional regulator [Halomonas elongata]MDL4861093.1 FadR/GntR family transcriptional regulator [Halomonas elongata]RAW07759.1 FadR family transcriptional regulator [Halomonas elongata]WBF17040.1 FadR family transcriptional regulator [Halomonas elongata]WPU45872.1 FadR/GntR family transcriptional regulator [Halomonas elongata DSM 2581]